MDQKADHADFSGYLPERRKTMNNSEEARRQKAKKLRYKKPISKELNLLAIKEKLYDIQEACEEVRWYTDSEDGEDSLLNALDGDEDEAYEFKMAFADLCAECEMMRADLEAEWIPECFDIFFVAAEAGDYLGWDSYEGDYFGISGFDIFAEDEAQKKLMKMKKDNLIVAIRQCFRVYQAYVGLQNRYDSLKAAIDILRDENTGILQVVKEIEKLYEVVSTEYTKYGKYAECSKEWMAFDRYANALPQEAWIS